MRWYVAVGRGKAMLFGVRGNRVVQTSPQMPAARGWQLTRLRGALRMQRVHAFYEVAR